MLITMLQTIPLPDSFDALLWVIITALAGVVVYLFRQLRKADERNMETQQQTLVGLRENSEAMRELATAMVALREQFSIKEDIEALRREIGHAKD